MEITTAEVALRVLMAGVLGALVGLDRELKDHPAGLRTHILVSLGAALFTLVGVLTAGAAGGGARVDPTRVAAQVVTGIGFLGAGAILREGTNIRGLTTAAGLWVTAAIGMAAGLGFYAAAAITTVAAVVALFGLKNLERRLFRRRKERPGAS
ncbi:MAG: MgtC/SapB family protein [Actinomycetota bacterium]